MLKSPDRSCRRFAWDGHENWRLEVLRAVDTLSAKISSMAKSLHDFVSDALMTVQEITPEEVEEIQARGGYTILDVREPNEYSEGHLVGAINVPRGFLEVKADLEHYKRDDRLADRSQHIVCYCGGGHRSALAAKTLMEMGFDHVMSMQEGWTGWTNRGLPTTLD